MCFKINNKKSVIGASQSNGIWTSKLAHLVVHVLDSIYRRSLNLNFKHILQVVDGVLSAHVTVVAFILRVRIRVIALALARIPRDHLVQNRLGRGRIIAVLAFGHGRLAHIRLIAPDNQRGIIAAH